MYEEFVEKITKEIEALRAQKDGAYFERNRCVALIARMAVSMGFKVAVTKTAIEGWSEDWHGCVYIELPTGQVSWHFHDSQAFLFEDLPKFDWVWDGHDTQEKYRRVDTAFQQPRSRPFDGDASLFQYALTMADRRVVVSRTQPSCPKCATKQVQLMDIGYIQGDSIPGGKWKNPEWKCRMCHHKFTTVMEGNV